MNVWRSLLIGDSERETESNQRHREKEREKTNKKTNESATVIVHICVAIVHKYTILHPLKWVFFGPKCVKDYLFLFYKIINQLM